MQTLDAPSKRLVHEPRTEQWQAMDRERDRMRLLLEVSESIASHRHIGELFHELAERLPDIVPFDVINLVLHDPARDVMRLHALVAPDFNKTAPSLEFPMHEVRTEHNFGEIIGESAALRRVLKEVETVAPTDSTVLIHGETGTGKELIARALHDLSKRRDRTFVKLNCAAIPTGLLESELFGHEKGAFTGAITQRIGRFELAHGGTLFLDEVGDIPPELQPKLLRALQEQEFERLGSARTIRVNVRLVAATNRDLAQMVADGQFRSDLFYRLNVFPVLLPPLRERSEDIPLLVRHFTRQFARRLGRQIESIPAEVMSALVGYPWPGNVREMQNVIERAVILSKNDRLRIAPQSLATAAAPQELDGQLDARQREAIEAALRASHGRVSGPTGAAKRLGLPHSTLEFRIKKLGIDKFQFRRK